MKKVNVGNLIYYIFWSLFVIVGVISLSLWIYNYSWITYTEKTLCEIVDSWICKVFYNPYVLESGCLNVTWMVPLFNYGPPFDYVKHWSVKLLFQNESDYYSTNILNNYKIGNNITCFYDINNPSMVQLLLPDQYFFYILYGLVLLGIGVTGVIAGRMTGINICKKRKVYYPFKSNKFPKRNYYSNIHGQF